jgi:hypothetical protein
MTGRQTAEQVKTELSETIASVLGDPAGELRLSIISLSEAVDGTTVVLVTDAKGNKRAVVLCSPANSPDMVDRAMVMAERAKTTLGFQLGARILDPLFRGKLGNESYAILPYCRPLSASPLLSRVQNFKLRPTLFDWLYQSAQKTRSASPSEDISRRFESRLEHLASMNVLSTAVRNAALLGIQRIRDGKWIPRHVLMHGDCWRGNVLIRPLASSDERQSWAERFVVIDWPGAEINGYALFDVVRMAQSMRVTFRQLRDEVDRHCDLLACERADAPSYLLAALGNLGMSLECFPVEQFAKMTEACHTTLKLCLA